MTLKPKTLSTLILALSLIGISNSAFSRDVSVNANEENKSLFSGWFGGDKSGVATINNTLYLDECGRCHFAYQPGLLPIASWEKVMSNLSNHFGEHIKVPDDKNIQIRNFLLDSAAGRTNRKISVKFVRSLHKGQIPLRISEIPYFIHKHETLSHNMVRDNPAVKSLSHCNACHTDATKGTYDKAAITIPGFDRWKD